MKKKKERHDKIPFHSGKDKRNMAIELKRKQVLAEANKRLNASLEALKGCKHVSDTEITRAFERAQRAKGTDLQNIGMFEERLEAENRLLQAVVKEAERVKRQEMKLHGMKGVINAQPAIKTAAFTRNALKLNQDLLKELQQAKGRKGKNGP